jgi:hypothetical protein
MSKPPCSWSAAWGNSWGASWGCGVINAVAGAIARRRPTLVILEYAGKQYRVPVGELENFLAKIREESAVKKIFKKRVRKNKKSQNQPVVKVIDAPDDEIEHINLAIDRSNEKLHHVWKILLQRKLLDLGDEETLLLLVMA